MEPDQLMPNHTFTYRAKALVPPLTELVAWLGSHRSKCAYDLAHIQDDVERENTKAEERRANTLPELSRLAGTPVDRKAAREQARLVALEQALEHDLRRATLWRDECLRAGAFKKFTLDETELEWLYRWKTAALSAG